MVKGKKGMRPKATASDLEEYLKKRPPPPQEHAHELKMKKRLKRLVERYEKLSEGELRFYSRQIMLTEVGYEGQVKLKNGKVCLVGLGGLGSTIATQLAAMGVGYIRLVDRDIVEESNLQRQHLYNYDVIGYPKVEAAVIRLEKQNPFVHFEPLPFSFNEYNANKIVKGMDVVVDGLDNMNARYTVNRACVKLGIPYVFGSAISNFGNTSTIIPKRTPCLECFYGKLDDSLMPTCSTTGVHPSVIAIVASIQVAETIKLLLGKQPSLKNKLLYCDVENMRFEEIAIARAENCPVCGVRPKTIPDSSKHVFIEELCGRNRKRVFLAIPKQDLKLSMKKLITLLEKEEKKVNVKARLGVTFTAKEGNIVSILKSGIMIIEGMCNQEETLDFYRGIVVSKMKIPLSKID